MIPVPSGVRVWLAVGRTDMRRGMNGLALQVQEALGRDPHAGDLYVFRGARGDLIKILWHDGLGMSLYAKRLEKGRFIWPSPADGVVAISASQRDRQPSACGASSGGLQPLPAGRPMKPQFSGPKWSKDGGKSNSATDSN
jgi:transposase